MKRKIRVSCLSLILLCLVVLYFVSHDKEAPQKSEFDKVYDAAIEFRQGGHEFRQTEPPMPAFEEFRFLIYMWQGSKNMLDGNPVSAVAAYNVAIHYKPDSSKAYLGRGLARWDRKHYARALFDFRMARKLDRDDPELSGQEIIMLDTYISSYPGRRPKIDTETKAE